MNKVLSLVLVLVLCMAMSAMAESPVAPSIAAPVTVATYPAVNLASDAAATAEVAAQLGAMQSKGKEAYFGADVAALIDAISQGNLVSVDALALTGYDASMGDVTATLSGANLQALAAGTKVAVAIGVPAGVADGMTTYTWNVLEGIADGNGGVQVTIPADVMAAANGASMMVAIFA